MSWGGRGLWTAVLAATCSLKLLRAKQASEPATACPSDRPTVIVKLGGSAVTVKSERHQLQQETLQTTAGQIREAIDAGIASLTTASSSTPCTDAVARAHSRCSLRTPYTDCDVSPVIVAATAPCTNCVSACAQRHCCVQASRSSSYTARAPTDTLRRKSLGSARAMRTQSGC